jgi:hypothetical protein
MEMNKKKWRARVVQTICTNGEDGRLVTIAPGEYLLSEGEGARYHFTRHAQAPICSSLWFAEVLLCSYMGQVEILGMWP